MKKWQRGSENDFCFLVRGSKAFIISARYRQRAQCYHCHLQRLCSCVLSPWSAWPCIHLRQTNLISSWDGSQGPLLMSPSPVALLWQQCHSDSVVAGHHCVRWLCSMAWACMVDKHSHRDTKSSFKQIDSRWTSSVCLHCSHRHGRF